MLCKIHNVNGKASFFWKKSNPHQTNSDDKTMLEKIKNGLKSDKITFIYHCWNHYNIPMGYE